MEEQQEWNYLRKMGMFVLSYPGQPASQPDIEHPFVTSTTRQTDYSVLVVSILVSRGETDTTTTSTNSIVKVKAKGRPMTFLRSLRR